MIKLRKNFTAGRKLSVFVVALVSWSASYAGGNDNSRGALHSVIVASDLTDDGRKVEHPTKEKPVYYLPRVIGYQALGEATAGELAVKPELVLHEAAKVLAKEGYLVATKETAVPTLILLFQWGYLKPSRSDEGAITTEFEGNKMTGLIAGQKAGDLYPKFDRDITEATYEDRYFVLIAAYDLAEYQKHKQKKLLWVTRMSTSMTKTSLEDVAPMLISQGGPVFGRDSGHPKTQIVPETKEGRVESGQLNVIELINPAEEKSSSPQK